MVETSGLLQLNNFTLATKTAIVTGAGQGMGEAFANILALNGANVAVCDLNLSSATKVADEIAAMRHKAIAFRCDVSNRREVSETVDDITDSLGPPTIWLKKAEL